MVAPELEGPRTHLRPLVEGDLPELGRIVLQPGVGPWWTDPSPAGVRESFFGRADTSSYALEVEGELAGALSSFEAGWPVGSNLGLAIVLGDTWQGQGYGPEALSVLIRHLVHVRGAHRFTVDPAVGNARAIRAYEKLGFRRVGVMRQCEPAPGGGWRDCLLMDLLPAEFTDCRLG